MAFLESARGHFAEYSDYHMDRLHLSQALVFMELLLPDLTIVWYHYIYHCSLLPLSVHYYYVRLAAHHQFVYVSGSR